MLTDEQRQNLHLTQETLVSELIAVYAEAKMLAERIEKLMQRAKGVETVMREDGKPQ